MVKLAEWVGPTSSQSFLNGVLKTFSCHSDYSSIRAVWKSDGFTFYLSIKSQLLLLFHIQLHREYVKCSDFQGHILLRNIIKTLTSSILNYVITYEMRHLVHNLSCLEHLNIRRYKIYDWISLRSWISSVHYAESCFCLTRHNLFIHSQWYRVISSTSMLS